MTVATTLPGPVAVYREEQNFAWWVYALLAVMAGVGVLFVLWDGGKAPPGDGWSGEIPVALAVGLALPAILVVGVLRMTTEVTPVDCRIWFGWIPTFHHTILLSSIQKVEVVEYRPLRDCGGWGIRRGRGGERVFNARGNRGVRVELTDGTRLLIGSQRPAELAQVLHGAPPPVP